MRVEWKVTRKGIWPWWTKENTNCLPSEATFFFSDFLAGCLPRCFFCNKHLYNSDGYGVGGGLICSSLMPHLKCQPPNLKNWGVSSRNCCLQKWHCWTIVLLTEKRTPYESPSVTDGPFQVMQNLGIGDRQTRVWFPVPTTYPPCPFNLGSLSFLFCKIGICDVKVNGTMDTNQLSIWSISSYCYCFC